MDLLNEISSHIGNTIGIPNVMGRASDPRFAQPKIDPGSWIVKDFLNGGYRRGRMVQFYGPEGVGKSLLAMMALAQHQKFAKNIGEEPIVAIFDFENAYDPVFAEFLGIDTDYLMIARPETGDKGFDAIQVALMTGKVQAMMIDSIAAMLPKADLMKALEDKTMGELAQMMSRGLRKVTSAQDTCNIYWINQIREKLGVMFGSPTTTPGGKSMAFYSSQTIEVKPGAVDKQTVQKLDASKGEFYDGFEIMGHEMKLVNRKDRTGSRRGAEASVWFKYVGHPDGPGIHEWDELWTLAFSYCEICLGHIGSHNSNDHPFRGLIVMVLDRFEHP